MKKLYILVSLALAAFTTNAQLTLSGTAYTQNFDTIANGLPIGWATYSAASSTSLGTLFAFSGGAAFGAWFDTTDCAADVFGHGFKNCASADAATDSMTCAQQSAVTNRALGVRQSSATGFDPGVSFALELANTAGFSGFNMAFRMQGLDIRSARTTSWTIDYGFGVAPTTFTTVTPILPLGGAVTSGGSKFTNDTVVVTFGTALDNQTGPVWIRISSLAKSTGAGNRTTSAIDDFNLTYKSTVGIASVSAQTIGFKTLGVANSGNANFTCNVAKSGQYSLNMYDITGRQICTKQVELTSGVQTTVSVNDKNLVAGMYIARITDGNAVGITKVIVQ